MEVIDQPSAETSQNNAELTSSEGVSERKRWGTPFSTQNAREMALRAHEKRREREENLRKAAEAKAQEPAEYVGMRLRRTRTQLEQLDGELESATDPKAIKALCDSIRALSEVERILAGRPLPGSNRPTKASTARPTAIEPSE